MAWRVCMLLLTLASAGAIPAVADPPATRPSAEDRLAAASLLHSARSLGHQPQAVARTGRILVLLEYAHRLCPDEVEISRQRVEIYEGKGDFAKAAESAAACLRVVKDDYALAARWIGLAESTANKAEDRIAFLEGVIADGSLAPAIRAMTVAELAGVYRRQGDVPKAAAACRQALALDPHQPLALREQEQLPGQGKPVDTFPRSLALLRGNPRSLQVAWEVAQRLQAAGECEAALGFYDHARALAEANPPAGSVLQTLLADYANALLDSGQADKAVEFLDPLRKTYELNLPLRALLVEALRSLKKDDQAAQVVQQMAKIYRLLEATSRPAGSTAAELAWFYLMYADQKERALEMVREGLPGAEQDRFVQRVLGATLIALGRGDEGAKTLATLAAKDPYAAAILARHYYNGTASTGPAAGEDSGRRTTRGQEKRPDLAVETLRAPANEPRTGPGWRALSALAAEHKVVLPPMAEAKALHDLAKEFPGEVLTMGRRPEEFVRVRLTPAKASVACGEPVELTVELENVSRQPVPLGQWGLFNPVVMLGLTAEGDAGATIPNLTAVVLPAPRYLEPGRSVRQGVRLDVGQAEQLLATNPLAELKVTVTATLDPLQQRERMVSSVPEIRIEPVTIQRQRLLSPTADKQAARDLLDRILRDLKEGDLPTQMRAARQVASLWSYLRLAETGKVKALQADVLAKPVLLNLTRAFLQAPSAAVRAEMVAALEHASLDNQIIGLLDPGDVSPLVRLRTIELLASKRTPGYKGLAGAFSEDKEPLVRSMATVAAGD